MSPIRRVLDTMRFSRSALSVFLLKQLYRQGVSALLEWWISKLTAVTSLTEFEIMRLREFLQCAIEFDRTGDTNGDAFLEFARGQTVRAAGSAGSIRVMTIHQAKGLGFDIVILPELNRKEALDRTSTTHAIALHRDDPDAAPDWAFRMPRNTIRQLDPVLSEETEVIRSRNCLEELCVLYVALTRARLGLYMIATSPGQTLDAGTLIRRRVAGNPSSQTRSSLILAGETFECGGSFGDPDWYQSIDSARTEPLSARITFPQDFKDRPARRPRLSRIEPSSHQRPVQSAACLFDAGSVRMRRIGSAIHDLFSRIEWLETSDINRIIEEWKGCRTFPDDIRGIAAAHFKKALQFEPLRKALSQPSPKAELWRERTFEIILPEGWVSGIFDRVTIIYDPDGGIPRAVIQDFKSNRIEDETDLASCVAENEPQMRMYRRSLAEILKIQPASIGLELILTGIGKIVSL